MRQTRAASSSRTGRRTARSYLGKEEYVLRGRPVLPLRVVVGVAAVALAAGQR